MKPFTFSKKGYYGNVFSLNLFNKEIIRLYRSYEKESYFLFGKKILSMKLSQRYLLRSIYNNSSIQSNFFLQAEIRNDLKLVFLIVDSLESAGGVETRLYHQANYFMKEGYTPVIITQYNLSEKLKLFPNILLDFRAPNFVFCLETIVKMLRPVFIEFQFKAFRYIYDINIDTIKRISTVGVCIHGVRKIDHGIMAKFDYRVYSCGQHTNNFDNAHHVPNFIKTASSVWSYKNQKKALFISRISADKLSTLDNFIQLCLKHGISYKVAGPIDYSNRKVSKFISKIESDALIGEIDTYAYLTQKADEYLFAAGVGQVPIEAASFGMPTLVIAHEKNSAYSTFLTAEMVPFFIEWNFVITVCPKKDFLGNTEAFFNDVADNKINKYLIADEIHKALSIEAVMPQYMNILENCR